MNLVRSRHPLHGAPALTALLLLSACGGGGAPSSSPQPPLSQPKVVARPAEGVAIEGVVSDAGGTVLGAVGGTSYWVVEVPQGTTLEAYLESLRADARIADVEEDLAFDAPEGTASTVPLFGDDPFASISVQPALLQIGAPDAWSAATGLGVRVAVVDTGISAAAGAIAASIEPDGFDFVEMDADPLDIGNGIDDDGDGRVDEGVGHGTFVASLVLAVAPGGGPWGGGGGGAPRAGAGRGRPARGSCRSARSAPTAAEAPRASRTRSPTR